VFRGARSGADGEIDQGEVEKLMLRSANAGGAGFFGESLRSMRVERSGDDRARSSRLSGGAAVRLGVITVRILPSACRKKTPLNLP